MSVPQMRHSKDASSPVQRRLTTPHWSVLLRALREASGVTQAGWASRLGYGLRTIQRWEHGDLAPDGRATQALAGLCAERGLFREYRRGVLAGLTLTADQLSEVLADARIAERDAPSQAHAADPASTAPSVRTQRLTDFVGRQQDLVAVTDLLETARLITLMGPGGVGKTRLAIEVARRAAAHFRDGIRLVELAPLTDSRLVPQALATVFGVREQAGTSLLDTLVDRLHGRQLLIVLDNCEQVLGGCAELVLALLHGCPEMRFLVTSRVVLGVQGETTWWVPGLSLPDPLASASEVAAQSEAVQLFVQRARAVAPGFILSSDTWPPVADVCRRLDGLPLAIELAAAWTRVLSPGELAQRLGDQLALLVTTGRGLPARHHSLRATLDWSYDLLAKPEQRVLARLAVLAGGAPLEVVEAVATTQADAGVTVLASLARLVDASLIERVESPGSESRFRLLETVREYALERLTANGEVDETRQRHAIAFVDVAEAARPHLTSCDQAIWLDRLERDNDNLREALSWAIEHQDAELSARLAASLTLFWYHRGHIAEGRALLDAALALPASAANGGLRVAMLQGKGLLALHHGDYRAARGAAETGVSIAREIGGSTSLLEILGVLGFVARVQEDWGAARGALEARPTRGF